MRISKYVHTAAQNRRIQDSFLRCSNTMRKDIKTLIIGDSIIREIPLANSESFSYSGVRINGLNNILINGSPTSDIPDVIVVNVGTNDVQNPSLDIMGEINLLVKTLENIYPGRIIIMMAIRHRPRDTRWRYDESNTNTDARNMINDSLDNACKNSDWVHFKRVHKIETMTRGRGKREILRDAFNRDGLHLSSKGKERYAVGIANIIYGSLEKQIRESSRINTSIQLQMTNEVLPNIQIRINTILFKGEESLISNFSPFRVYVFNRTYSCTECAYQSAKAFFCGLPYLAYKIVDMESGRQAKKLAEERVRDRYGWDDVKIKVMKYITLTRVIQDNVLRQFLLANHRFNFVENTGNFFWARGTNGDGLNAFGKIIKDASRMLANESDEIFREMQLLHQQMKELLVDYF